MNLELWRRGGQRLYGGCAGFGGKRYPLTVEFQAPVPDFPGITMLIVRLADDLGDIGDVLCRLISMEWPATGYG